MSTKTAPMTAHQRIAAWRRARGMTLADVSASCSVGISCLSEIEHERRGVRIDQVEAIARALGLTMPQFYDDRLLRLAMRGRP